SGISGAAVTSVSGSGSSYTVTVNTGSGDGTLGLNLVDDDSIADTVGNKLGGTGAGNGSFTGQVYTVDKTAPTISGVATPTPNAAGWYASGAGTVPLTCADPVSREATCPADMTLSAEAANQSVSGTATDTAANRASATAQAT